MGRSQRMTCAKGLLAAGPAEDTITTYTTTERISLLDSSSR